MGPTFRTRPARGSTPLPPSPAAGAPGAPRSRRTGPQRALRLAIALLVVGELLDGARTLRRRTGRRVGAWWDDVEHRERRRSRQAELLVLARRLDPGHAVAERP
jgi:hypothetical protein